MKHPLRGEVVLVTGGGSGIGRLMALGAAARGAEVVLWDRDGAAADRVRDEIGDAARSFAVDVTDVEAVTAAAAEVGRLDVLINNAGVVTGKPLLEASEDEIRRTYDVNVLALYWVTRAFLGGMVERRHGAVVTIASAAGLVGVAKQTDYSASKFAAFGFTESLRVELAKAKTGVRTLTVCPYYIDTGMFEGVRTRFPRLLPILKPEYVATRVLEAIEKGKAQLVMPRFVNAVALGRLFPPPQFDSTMNLLGINSTMDHFTGRSLER
ncbi:MAG: SDR family oxidoreductase [Microbacterium sp.]